MKSIILTGEHLGTRSAISQYRKIMRKFSFIMIKPISCNILMINEHYESEKTQAFVIDTLSLQSQNEYCALI